MPFGTDPTSVKTWTSIYEDIIKPAVEDSGLDFECNRSKPTRGNILREIVVNLNESDLVIADMTDNNANVCYELGLRHGLKVGTILLAQKREFLNIFDLHNYASHVYDWKNEPGRKNMIKQIRELLKEYLQDPLKLDNPAQDFLGKRPSFTSGSKKEIKDILEYDSKKSPHILISKKQLSGKLAVGLILLGNSETGCTMPELVKQVSKNWKRVSSTYISPLISQMGGWVMKEGQKREYTYRLSTKGKREILNLVKLMKTK